MNTLIAKVKLIDTVDNLNIVKLDFFGTNLSMMSLELANNIKTGSTLKLGTKPTHVAIAKNFSGEVSYSNRLNAKILHVENGKLLSSVKLQTNDTVLESIITRDSSVRMGLKEGDEVTAFIKANELSVIEVIDD